MFAFNFEYFSFRCNAVVKNLTHPSRMKGREHLGSLGQTRAHFNVVHRVLMARVLEWFAIPSSTRPHFVRTLHCDLSILGGPTWQSW